MTSVKPPRGVPIQRQGAGIPVDRARLVRMGTERLLSRADLALKMSHGPCPSCGRPYSHSPRCQRRGEFTVTPDAIAKIENGQRRPKTVTLARMCEAVGCQPADLLPREDREIAPGTR